MAAGGLALLLGGALAVPAQAATYVLPKGDVVGQVQFATASGRESLAQIARHYNVGLDAIVAANPHLDRQRPAAGARVTIPGRHLLPRGPREGIVIDLARKQLYFYYTPPPQDLQRGAAVAALAAAADDSPPAAAPAPAAAQEGGASGAQEGQIAPVKPIAPIAPFAALGVPPPAPPATVPLSEIKTANAHGALPQPQTQPQTQMEKSDPESMGAPVLAPEIPPPPPMEMPSLVSVYPIGIGPEARAIEKGAYSVMQRLSQPTWRVPAALRAAQPRLPEVVMPGPGNPLGSFAAVLDGGGYMIHGTHRPEAIGSRMDRGAIAMYPEDIELFIHRISTGTPVRVVNEPVRHGYKNGALYLEMRKPDGEKGELNDAALVNWMSTLVSKPLDVAEWQRVRMVAEAANGMAMPLFQLRPRPRAEGGWWLQLNSYKSAKAARDLINKIEVMEVPVTMTGCYDKLPCKVLAGPFKDKLYIEELRKKIKWVTGVRASVIPYREEDDFQLPRLTQKVARNP